MDPVLVREFRALTPSQRGVGKYFLVVAAVLLVQILAGAIMAHYYSERSSFYGIAVDRFLPFNFLRDVHIQSPIVWIGVVVDRRGAVPRTGHRRQRSQGPGRSRRPAVLGHAGHRRRRAARQLSRHHGHIGRGAGSGSAIRACPTSSSAAPGRSASSPAWRSGACWCFRALWPTAAQLAHGDAPVLVAAASAWSI